MLLWLATDLHITKLDVFLSTHASVYDPPLQYDTTFRLTSCHPAICLVIHTTFLSVWVSCWYVSDSVRMFIDLMISYMAAATTYTAVLTPFCFPGMQPFHRVTRWHSNGLGCQMCHGDDHPVFTNPVLPFTNTVHLLFSLLSCSDLRLKDRLLSLWKLERLNRILRSIHNSDLNSSTFPPVGLTVVSAWTLSSYICCAGITSCDCEKQHFFWF